MSKTIEVEKSMTVGSLAEQLMIPVSKLIGELMKNGVMVTVNERIDIDTAQIIIDELGLEVTLAVKDNEPKATSYKNKKVKIDKRLKKQIYKSLDKLPKEIIDHIINYVKIKECLTLNGKILFIDT